MIEVSIVADSVNICGNRLTSFVCKHPRFILAEVNTHRMFSRNSASSRAIPTPKLLAAVLGDPFIPFYWGKNQKGMQADEELSSEKQSDATEIWLTARDNAVRSAEQLMEIGVHKQIANRLLEPFMWHTCMITATDFENFFALRAHKAAQPEFQALAYEMLQQYNDSKPKLLQPGAWHIPFGDKMVDGLTDTQKLKVATARAARISYLTFDGEINYEADYKLHDSLEEAGHYSPFEMCAMALDRPERYGNFKGFKQYRKFFDKECRSDNRILKVAA